MYENSTSTFFERIKSIPALPNAGFTVPLTRVKRPPSTTRAGFEGVDHNCQPLGDIHPSSLKEAPSFLKTTVKNADSYAYLIRVGVGGQFFDVILDTGSSDMWVVSSECTDDDCKRISKYLPTSSLKTSDKNFKLEYLTADVSGQVGFETVTFGQFEVASQVVALVNETHNMGLTAARASGVLGLAFPYESSIPPSLGRTLLESMFANLDPESRFFTFRLSYNDTGNTFSFGEHDPAMAALSSEIQYTPVYTAPGQNYDYWKLQMYEISINGQTIPGALSPSKVPGTNVPIAVLDTGTTLVLGPSRDVDAFWGAVGGARKGDDGRWRVLCEHAVVVGFVLGNETERREFSVDPADLSWRATGGDREEGWCIGGVQSNDGVFSGDWLLGDVFLRNVYVVHQSASSSSPPLIGLVSTTNTSSAMVHFQSLRGNDSVQSPAIDKGAPIGYSELQSSALQPWLLLSLSGVLAFFGSICSAVLVRLVRDRFYRRKAISFGRHGRSGRTAK